MVHPSILPGNHRTFLGHELVGHVIEIGPDSTLHPGDRVIRKMRGAGGSCSTHGLELCPYCQTMDENHCERTGLPSALGGGLGEEFLIPDGGLYLIPNALSDEQAVLVEPAACALHGVLRCPPKGVQKVLVLGTGTIGFFVIQVLRAICPTCHITAVAEFPYQYELALRYGADQVWLTSEDILTHAAKTTGGTLYLGFRQSRTMTGGFDTVYDCVGNAHTLQLCLRMTRAKGNVVLIGVNLKPMTIDLTPVWYNEVNLMGTVSYGHSLWQGERISDYDRTIQWMLAGTLVTDGFITHRYPFSEYRTAITAAVNKKKSHSVKVTLSF